MDLATLGWNDTWEQHLRSASVPGGQPARVMAEHRELYLVQTAAGEMRARASGRMRHFAWQTADLPAVGDWVVLTAGESAFGSIHAVLPRKSKFSRKVAGDRADEQVVGANVDTVWVISALDSDLNAARLERYLTMVWESGASPVIVLTKADLVDAPDAVATDLGSRVPGVPIHAVSAVNESGLQELRRYTPVGQTIALVGSSGVGKSTLLNRLAGESVMAVSEVREYDGKGRHTTTHRQLVPLPNGGLLLDTPGMRELQLWHSEVGLDATFDDIAALASECRFGDCRHETEPDCAVREAVESGQLPTTRLESYWKLQRELSFLRRKVDVRAAVEEKRQIKRIMKEYRRRTKPDS